MWLPGGSDRTHSDPGGGRGRSEKRWPGGGEKVGEEYGEETPCQGEKKDNPFAWIPDVLFAAAAFGRYIGIPSPVGASCSCAPPMIP